MEEVQALCSLAGNHQPDCIFELTPALKDPCSGKQQVAEEGWGVQKQAEVELVGLVEPVEPVELVALPVPVVAVWPCRPSARKSTGWDDRRSIRR